MLAAAFGLKASGGALERASGDVGGAIRRTGSHGPFFAMLDTRLQRSARRFDMTGTGLRTVARRLEEDAKREQALRRMEAERAAKLADDPLSPKPWTQRGL